jgi:hypothetical protein
MPQVWLTYSELAAHFRVSEGDARNGVIRDGWDRMKCPDRLTRALLPPEAANNYLVEYVLSVARRPDAMVASLRSALAQSGVNRQDVPVWADASALAVNG